MRKYGVRDFSYHSSLITHHLSVFLAARLVDLQVALGGDEPAVALFDEGELLAYAPRGGLAVGAELPTLVEGGRGASARGVGLDLDVVYLHVHRVVAREGARALGEHLRR